MQFENPVINGAIQSAMKLVAETDNLMPMFFVGNNDETNVVATPFRNDDEKNQAAAAVRHFAAKMNANFILFISEAWTLKTHEASEDYMANREKYKYDMGNHPDAVEIAMFQVETEATMWMGSCEIGKDRTLGELKWVKCETMKGRFANLLGKKETVQ